VDEKYVWKDKTFNPMPDGVRSIKIPPEPLFGVVVESVWAIPRTGSRHMSERASYLKIESASN
jgi:hypothetical protein